MVHMKCKDFTFPPPSGCKKQSGQTESALRHCPPPFSSPRFRLHKAKNVCPLLRLRFHCCFSPWLFFLRCFSVVISKSFRMFSTGAFMSSAISGDGTSVGSIAKTLCAPQRRRTHQRVGHFLSRHPGIASRTPSAIRRCISVTNFSIIYITPEFHGVQHSRRDCFLTQDLRLAAAPPVRQ